MGAPSQIRIEYKEPHWKFWRTYYATRNVTTDKYQDFVRRAQWLLSVEPEYIVRVITHVPARQSHGPLATTSETPAVR